MLARREEENKKDGPSIGFASVRRYVAYARDDAELGAMMCGAVRRQARLVLLSRWSNAFNYDSSGHGRSAGSAMRIPTVQHMTHILPIHYHAVPYPHPVQDQVGDRTLGSACTPLRSHEAQMAAPMLNLATSAPGPKKQPGTHSSHV